MTRDGILNIRNVGLSMVCCKPSTAKEKKFKKLFIKINEKYYDKVRWDYPSDAILKELKDAFSTHDIISFFYKYKINYFYSQLAALYRLQEQGNWNAFLEEFLTCICGVDNLQYPTMSKII